MHIVDISALYSPTGGGIRTYTRHKLRAAVRLGHELTVIVPGADDSVEAFGPRARLVNIPSPRFPLDRSYFYFDSDAVIHDALDAWRPDFVEASSPWGSATAVAEWRGAAPRALIMHAEPLSAWAYRWFEGVASHKTIDRGFDWFWRHLRRLDAAFDLVISAAPSLTERLAGGGMLRVETIPMGVEPGIFSPAHRDPALRARLLERCGLPEDATLLLGSGRFSPEKRWPMVIAGAESAGLDRPLGLAIIGDGHARASVVRAAGENPHVQLLAPIGNRAEFARLMASADLLVHGSSAETFGMVQAEARASGLPMVVPDSGAAFDQLVPGQGMAYVTGDAASAASAIGAAIDELPALRAASAAAAPGVRTMDRHFEALFGAYEGIAARRLLVA
ncbi:glycosyl transferase [Polymorphobacter glacialis]|uniref:Glycosyl transferase n=1 Tax=Sandarakinorhabdus glacialis TaxID=1614636 RepID=A0A916ZIH9_9SPHN|nr:glycosyltransferase [Polymorphobacter glacialis]GGD98193.1 glycosyl transferase [Polymorphobacter glacialis]